MTLGEISVAAGGEILSGSVDTFVGGANPGGISIDTRDISPGEWFIALRGKAGRDGHEFIDQAIAGGASGFIISDRSAFESKIRPAHPDLPTLLVPDTTLALADIARALLDKFNPFVIAVTGTVGKTSVKENIAHIVSAFWPTLKNESNWNTEIGVPLTVFNLEKHHRVVVLECASRGLGQIHDLSMITRPHIAVVTAIGPGHLSEFGSIDNVAKAKWEIIDGLKPGGIVVAPGESAYTAQYVRGLHLVTFGFDRSCNVHPLSYRFNPTSTEITISTPAGMLRTLIPGSARSDISNALCAIAVCSSIRIPGTQPEALTLQQIAGLLRDLPLVPGRSEIIIRPSGIEVIFDAYNSNPMSLENALDAFARRELLSDGKSVKRRVAIIGDMLELGPDEEKFHHDAGILIGRLPIDCLITVGRLSTIIRGAAEQERGHPIAGTHFDSAGDAADYLKLFLIAGDLVLIKASRAIGLEDLLQGDW
jgi:UDP-N-acetylmuramoyl-tripeptide--D-alanyl-D-alanine ligase